jgi:hypothetical protein
MVMIRLAGSKFPAVTKRFQLDILAREAYGRQVLTMVTETGMWWDIVSTSMKVPRIKVSAVNITSLEPVRILSNEPAI